MPVRPGQDAQGNFMRWGSHGAKYYYHGRVVDLLHIHLTCARAETAPGSAHALDLTALQSPDISFWTIWEDETLLGAGALKRLSADQMVRSSQCTRVSPCAEGEREARCCATSLRLHERAV